MTPSLFIAGHWTAGCGSRSGPVLDPATGEEVGRVPFAEAADLDVALAAAARGFALWRATSAFERSGVLRRAAALLRERHEAIATAITREQGKPLGEAKLEVLGAADHVDWGAEEGRRAYGRVIPARAPDVTQMVVQEPVGPVAAFSPWNFPVSQLVRKIAGALAAGCSIIAKAPEETPTSAVLTVRCFEEAGLPAGVLQLVFGVPAEISERLIASPVIRKVSFTGSVAVGRHLSQLAGRHLKRATMELGGHAPFIVGAGVDPAPVAALAAQMKFRNAGQVCVSPTRFLVHESLFESFVEAFAARASALTLGSGLDPATGMGPLAQARRVQAVEALVRDAVDEGAEIRTGGRRAGNQGFFFEPTILTTVPLAARVLNEEPFGPIAVVNPFAALDDAIAEANRLPFGLAAYAMTNGLVEAEKLGAGIEAGMVSINHSGLALPETPFGGIKDSGHGSEGGVEGLRAYLQDKFVSRRHALGG
ncbi:NAD-dependent succinate-semialdehyde dehydrogenase [Aureimonas endophytica]|uniref:NAD-dependent succinate-semialdehyde dehydrogenase n=1 Tax=Aureimonas endophytica TaxID=2027858 RepID=A0A917A0H5_9HYPH|nr:NAD-dependent succinate-semialdehyde dehydrogenase [Aureimonas endophytica]GGE21223.1 NAD-dependent succinate-semialdehyde dehydrogenase [Aureimonas endophytica]